MRQGNDSPTRVILPKINLLPRKCGFHRRAVRRAILTPERGDSRRCCSYSAAPPHGETNGNEEQDEQERQEADQGDRHRQAEAREGRPAAPERAHEHQAEAATPQAGVIDDRPSVHKKYKIALGVL